MSNRLRLTCSVKGDGLWGAKPQTVTGVLVFKVYEPDESCSGFAEGRFYLDEWDIHDGLIYTDSGFMDSLHLALDNLDIPGAEKINYSECGMQGDDYVSMDTSYNLARKVEQAGYDISLPKEGVTLENGNKTQKELLSECVVLSERAIACC